MLEAYRDLKQFASLSGKIHFDMFYNVRFRFAIEPNFSVSKIKILHNQTYKKEFGFKNEIFSLTKFKKKMNEMTAVP